MRKRLAAMALIALAAGVAVGPQAGAQTDGLGGSGPVTATVLAGTRTVSVAGGVALAGVQGATVLSGTYAVEVAEAARSGTNPWSVQAAISDLTRVGATDTLDKGSIALTARGVTLGTTVKVGTGADPAKDTSLSDTLTTGNAFSSAQILFRIMDEDPSTAYTNAYLGTGTIEADVTGLPAGTYSGTITYTLVQ